MLETKRKAIPKNIREKVFVKYFGRCAYCGCELTMKSMQVDHIKPIKRGGSDELENYNPACRSCNFYKSTFELEDYRKYVLTLISRLEKIFIFRMAINYSLIRITPTSVKDFKFYFEIIESEENNGNQLPIRCTRIFYTRIRKCRR